MTLSEAIEDFAGWLDAAGSEQEGFYAVGKVSAKAAADRLRDILERHPQPKVEDTAAAQISDALTAHRVINDGIETGWGWCETCGNVEGGDQEDHQALILAGLGFRVPGESDYEWGTMGRWSREPVAWSSEQYARLQYEQAGAKLFRRIAPGPWEQVGA